MTKNKMISEQCLHFKNTETSCILTLTQGGGTRRLIYHLLICSEINGTFKQRKSLVLSHNLLAIFLNNVENLS